MPDLLYIDKVGQHCRCFMHLKFRTKNIPECNVFYILLNNLHCVEYQKKLRYAFFVTIRHFVSTCYQHLQTFTLYFLFVLSEFLDVSFDHHYLK